MTNLLNWATTGTGVLVGVTDPADATSAMLVVPGTLEQDCQGQPVLRYTLPSGEDRTVEARRLSSTSAALHVTDAGQGYALTVFPEGSEAHLRWLIRAAQQGIRLLLGDRTVNTTQASRRLTELAGTLHSLMLRADLMAEPTQDGARPAA